MRLTTALFTNALACGYFIPVFVPFKCCRHFLPNATELFLHRIIKGSERDIFLLKNMLLREFYSFFTSVDLNGACIQGILNEEKVSRARSM